jgi:hypothetical protein
MPAKAIVSLILIVIAAAAITLFAALKLGLPAATIGLAATLAALWLRFRMPKQ